MPRKKLYRGDCRDVLKERLEANSVDSVVTDCPYELGFMGKHWDQAGVSFDPRTWKRHLRVLKPGGYLLAFGGSRTYHRIAVAIEDAGFEIRDCIVWMYGSGFPKSHDISKAIDKEAGAERRVIGVNPSSRPNSKVKNSRGFDSMLDETESAGMQMLTAPSTPEAEQWNGWGTALKPAMEPIIVARKPLSEKTVAKNVLRWGTGGLNIDGCRIGENSIKGRFPANVILDEEAGRLLGEPTRFFKCCDFEENELLCERLNAVIANAGSSPQSQHVSTALALAVSLGDREGRQLSGVRGHSTVETQKQLRKLCEIVTETMRSLERNTLQELKLGKRIRFQCHARNVEIRKQTDTTLIMTVQLKSSGSAESVTLEITLSSMAHGVRDFPNRLFYCAKASKAEREIGCNGIPESVFHRKREDKSGKLTGLNTDPRWAPVLRSNTHPTVKPVALMRYLCRLVTPVGGTVLDGFMGSGTTGMAALLEGFGFIGIEAEREFYSLAKARIGHVYEIMEFIEWASEVTKNGRS